MRMRRLAVAAGWVGGLALAAFVLRWAGRGALAAPPLGQPDRWAAWLESRGPLAAGFACLRLVAEAGLWYVVVATFVGTALRLIGAASMVRVADRLTIGPVRRMLAGTMTMGLAASGLLAVAAPALRTPVAVAQTVQPTTSSTTVPPATITMHRIGPAEAVVPRALAPVPEIAPTIDTAQQWTVRPGECFWSIAEQVLTEHIGRAVTDDEIVPYWRRLIDANRSALVHRENPDLILPGQLFTVPAP
jgi:nucleoid-associated protein YgaU